MGKFLKTGNKEAEFNDLFEQAKSFNDKKDFFLETIIRQVKSTAYYHGVGNCALMADAAFLEAINQEDDLKLTYLRFMRTDKKVDVLNCIALGNWPDSNCVIIAP